MGEPNYAYCKSFCTGYMNNCSHYQQATKLFKVCFHYKLLHKHAGHVLNFTKADQSKLEELARKL